MLDIIHPDSSQAWINILENGIQDLDLSIRMEFQIRHIDGTWRTLEAICKNLVDTTNEIRIAINSRDISERVQKERELENAYNATLEGWSRALELRDKVTDGHSKRVTEMTVRLAAEIGVQGNDLIHVRRGALLHDIGKMGIPDNILQKRGPLNEEEWEVMRRHPEYAYNMLAPIPYLQAALDIPYYHHEKWDGTGYPKGLKGNEIPLSARVFAIVDVWDALLSDRPYSDAWSKEKAREYISNQSGKHFDPHDVEIFFKFLLI